MTSKRQQQEEAGRWLRRERERRGLRTAGALARRMGVSDSLVSRIETGATAATDERAEQIAEALDLDIITVRRNLGLWVPDSQDEKQPDRPGDIAEIREEMINLTQEFGARIQEWTRRLEEIERRGDDEQDRPERPDQTG